MIVSTDICVPLADTPFIFSNVYTPRIVCLPALDISYCTFSHIRFSVVLPLDISHTTDFSFRALSCGTISRASSSILDGIERFFITNALSVVSYVFEGLSSAPVVPSRTVHLLTSSIGGYISTSLNIFTLFPSARTIVTSILCFP
jgi:hypothetical protein